ETDPGRLGGSRRAPPSLPRAALAAQPVIAPRAALTAQPVIAPRAALTAQPVIAPFALSPARYLSSAPTYWPYWQLTCP
ncbi:MAG: hypothetical protein SO127_06800, partial [Muribaculaceae bacterium]|nr:hypothetical protein [Muribaculaceae bacterium]